MLTTTTKTRTCWGYTPSVPTSIAQQTTHGSSFFGELDLESIDAVLSQAQEALEIAKLAHGGSSSAAASTKVQLIDDDESDDVVEYIARKTGIPGAVVSQHHHASQTQRLDLQHPQQHQRIIPIDLADLIMKTEAFLSERYAATNSNDNSNVDDVSCDDTSDDLVTTAKQLVGEMIVHGGKFLWKSVRQIGRRLVKRTVPAVIERVSTFFTRVKQVQHRNGPKVRSMAKSVIGMLNEQKKAASFAASSICQRSSLPLLRLLAANKAREQKYKSTFAVPTTTTHRFFMTEISSVAHPVQTLCSSYEKSFSSPSSSFLKEMVAEKKKRRRKTNVLLTAAKHMVSFCYIIQLSSAWISSIFEGIHGNDSRTGPWNEIAVLKWARIPRYNIYSGSHNTCIDT